MTHLETTKSLSVMVLFAMTRYGCEHCHPEKGTPTQETNYVYGCQSLTFVTGVDNVPYCNLNLLIFSHVLMT